MGLSLERREEERKPMLFQNPGNGTGGAGAQPPGTPQFTMTTRLLLSFSRAGTFVSGTCQVAATTPPTGIPGLL